MPNKGWKQVSDSIISFIHELSNILRLLYIFTHTYEADRVHTANSIDNKLWRTHRPLIHFALLLTTLPISYSPRPLQLSLQKITPILIIHHHPHLNRIQTQRLLQISTNRLRQNNKYIISWYRRRWWVMRPPHQNKRQSYHTRILSLWTIYQLCWQEDARST